MGTKLDAFTSKITLVEFDSAQIQTLFFNWTAGVWYIDFRAIYERIDPVYLAGVSSQSIIKVSSIMQDGVQLTVVADVATCITTNKSFFYDIVLLRLHIHLDNGAEPSAGHSIQMGITSGVSNVTATYNGVYYEPRLKSVQVISKSKDPLFFGRISFDGGSIGIDNADGAYDSIMAPGSGLFGSAIRILQGFDTDAYASFLKLGDGVIDGAKVDQLLATIDMVDKRKALSRMAPRRVFDVGTYPNLNYADAGKPIPLAYGALRDVTCTCLNQEATAPATWDFKICDCTDHAIQSIDQIYVKGVKRTATTSSLANGIFSLNGCDYAVGDLVTADMHGYVTGGAVLIQNPADIILDLLNLYLGIPYTSTFFNTTEWAAATALAMNVAIFVDSAVEVFQIIEDICRGSLLNMIQQDDGTFTARIYDPARAVADTYAADQLLATPSIEYDTTQILSSTSIGYNKNWSKGSFFRLHDTSQEAAIFAAFNVYRERAFDTLLTNGTDAQTFSNAVLAIAGKAMTKVRTKFKLQPVGREIMDFVMLPIYRQSGKTMLGTVKAEIIGIDKDLLGATVSLVGRVV
jgi:hypothetical protein